MATPILQCGNCLLGNTVKWIIEKDNITNYLICENYPDGMPDYVEQVEKDCPKFKKER